jgi:hypothetical protein
VGIDVGSALLRLLLLYGIPAKLLLMVEVSGAVGWLGAVENEKLWGS